MWRSFLEKLKPVKDFLTEYVVPFFFYVVIPAFSFLAALVVGYGFHRARQMMIEIMQKPAFRKVIGSLTGFVFAYLSVGILQAVLISLALLPFGHLLLEQGLNHLSAIPLDAEKMEQFKKIMDENKSTIGSGLSIAASVPLSGVLLFFHGLIPYYGKKFESYKEKVTHYSRKIWLSKPVTTSIGLSINGLYLSFLSVTWELYLIVLVFIANPILDLKALYRIAQATVIGVLVPPIYAAFFIGIIIGVAVSSYYFFMLPVYAWLLKKKILKSLRVPIFVTLVLGTIVTFAPLTLRWIIRDNPTDNSVVRLFKHAMIVNLQELIIGGAEDPQKQKVNAPKEFGDHVTGEDIETYVNKRRQFNESFARLFLEERFKGLPDLVDAHTGHATFGLKRTKYDSVLDMKADAEKMVEAHKKGEGIKAEALYLSDLSYEEKKAWAIEHRDEIMQALRDKNPALYGNAGFFNHLFFSLYPKIDYQMKDGKSELVYQSGFYEVFENKDLFLIMKHLADIFESKIEYKTYGYFYYERVQAEEMLTHFLRATRGALPIQIEYEEKTYNMSDGWLLYPRVDEAFKLEWRGLYRRFLNFESEDLDFQKYYADSKVLSGRSLKDSYDAIEAIPLDQLMQKLKEAVEIRARDKEPKQVDEAPDAVEGSASVDREAEAKPEVNEANRNELRETLDPKALAAFVLLIPFVVYGRKPSDDLVQEALLQSEVRFSELRLFGHSQIDRDGILFDPIVLEAELKSFDLYSQSHVLKEYLANILVQGEEAIALASGSDDQNILWTIHEDFLIYAEKKGWIDLMLPWIEHGEFVVIQKQSNSLSEKKDWVTFLRSKVDDPKLKSRIRRATYLADDSQRLHLKRIRNLDYDSKKHTGHFIFWSGSERILLDSSKDQKQTWLFEFENQFLDLVDLGEMIPFLFRFALVPTALKKQYIESLGMAWQDSKITFSRSLLQAMMNQATANLQVLRAA